MSLIISHNLSALNTQRNLQGSGEAMAKSIEKLSSGYKINVGADDPSGLIVSEQLRSQISGLERAVRNSSEAFNLIGIAEGALNEMNTILKKLRSLAIHAANSGITSPEQVAADQAEMDSGIETLNRIANTTRYSDQYLLNGQKQLVYDVTTVVNEPTDHALLDTKMSRVDQVFKRDGTKMSIGFSGEKNQYQANTDTSAQRAYLEADNAHSLCEIDGATVTTKQEFILTGTSGSRLFSFAEGAHVGTIVENINNVKDSTGIGAALVFASDVRIDRTVGGTYDGSVPDYKNGLAAQYLKGYNDGTYVYQTGDVQVYNAGLNNVNTAKISEICLTPDAASAFKVGFNCDGDGKVYAKVVDKSTNSIEYYKDKDCTMLIGQGDGGFFAATNNSGIPSSPTRNLDGLFIRLNPDYAMDQDVYEIAVVGQRLDNQKDMNVTGIQGWTDSDSSVMSGINLGVNTDPEGSIFFDYVPMQMEADGKTVKTFQVNVYKHPSKQPQFLVASSGVVENNVKVASVLNPDTGRPQLAGQTVRVESVIMDNGVDSGLNITLVLPKKSDLRDASGLTLDEIKADPEYVAKMTELTGLKGKYAEIEPDYLSAKKAREDAKVRVANETETLRSLREDEAKVRREIDRLQARDIPAQLLDAQTDLMLAQTDMVNAARDSIVNPEDPAVETAYMNVAKTLAGKPNFFGVPETFAENVANAVMAEIEAERLAGSDTTAIDWTDPARIIRIRNDAAGRAPLTILTAAERTALDADINTLFTEAYDAATEDKLVRNIVDTDANIRSLGRLQADHDAALAALNAAKENFNGAVEDAVQVVNTASWGGAQTTGALGITETIANSVLTAVQQHIDVGIPPAADGAAEDPNIDFLRYDWSTVKTGILDSIGPPSLTPQERAIASDMYDLMAANPEMSAYAVAKQKEYANPPPVGATTQANLNTEIGAAAGVLEDPAAGAANTNVEAIKSALTNVGSMFNYQQLVGEIADLIFQEVTNSVPALGTALTSVTGTECSAVKSVISLMLPGSSGASALDDALVGLGLSGDTEINRLVEDLWINITKSGSALYKHVDEYNKNQAAMAGLATPTANLGIMSSQPALAGLKETLVLDANATIAAIDGTSTAPAVAPAVNPLSEAVANALSRELVALAREGIDVADPANLTGTNRSLIIESIINAVSPGIVSGGPASLRQFVTDVFDTYTLETTNPVNSGRIDNYTALVETYADLAERLPGGGKIPRAEDRLESYGTRLEEAPMRAKIGATTRTAWADLIVDYGHVTNVDDALTKLGEDFGKYVKGLVDSALAQTPPQPMSSIRWNDGSNSSVYANLLRMMQGDSVLPATVPPSPALPSSAGMEALYDAIALDAAAGSPNETQGKISQADLRKIVDRMFTSIANPDYLGDETTGTTIPNRPAAPQAGDKYIPVSPVNRYAEQDALVKELKAELAVKVDLKETIDDNIDGQTIKLEVAVDALKDAEFEFAYESIEADPLQKSIGELEAELKAMRDKAGGGKVKMPPGNMSGSVMFTNLGLRVFAVDYGSAETIRIQNKAGNLFYQYRESDTLEKIMIEPDTTVQVAGQDAQISLNGAPVFTNGLIAETTTPDFAGALVFNAGVLGEATLAVAGYDTGKLFSKATALQGIEENEAEIGQLRRHFEPPAMSVAMGENDPAEKGMLNKNGNPVNLYMDFSQIDPTVEVKIDNYVPNRPIQVSFAAPNTLTINANSLGTDPENEMTITVKVDPRNLLDGYYVTDPALKGLFIRSDDLVDLNKSAGEFSPTIAPTISAEGGDVMLEVNTYATNPRSNTSESLDNFIGGMQFQLGNTEGDQDRTVYSIQSMAMSELGRINWNGQEYCLQNVLGGGLASLTKDPILAMRVLAQAVDDVSTLRARLGAFQANMLQSNINALGVAVENITKTEAAIRDTDMAEQSTQFTRFQIMQQAGTSMLAQANQVSRNVLSLLQG